MKGSRQTGRSGARLRLFCAFMLFGATASLATAGPQQESPPPAAESAPAPATPEASPANGPLEVAIAAPQDEKVDSDRRRKLRLAILTGGLIGVTGLALVIFTILGGSATRRGLRRKPLKDGPPPLEPIPAQRFDERESVSSKDNATPADDDDHSAHDSRTR